MGVITVVAGNNSSKITFSVCLIFKVKKISLNKVNIYYFVKICWSISLGNCLY